ncbi:MAG: electron transfer flavoprotein subunit alpha/FixB family protein [Bacteroidetes bacterium]|nr:MAG: electron transfer flavoprotein subunit alpha/FixB family protein [Bacteroidota bacterium]
MSILIFAETADGQLKKPAFEAATYACDLAQKSGEAVHAVAIGPAEASTLEKLGQYGVSTVHHVHDEAMNAFANAAYAAAVTAVAESIDARVVVLPQTYNGRAIAPRIAVKLDAALFSGVISLVDPANGFDATRSAYSGKGIEEIKTQCDKLVITVKANGYRVEAQPTEVTVAAFAFQPEASDLNAIARELIKASEGISLTEAEIVVSAGRGMKGPENWGMIEELAGLLGAATACSKPTADMGWRPHHEHVGQTGIQIAPNLYIAIGISGAIQHLAGVSSSKNIVVINKDPEAPFFKVADYGIVGDLFEVVPRLIEAIKAARAAA